MGRCCGEGPQRRPGDDDSARAEADVTDGDTSDGDEAEVAGKVEAMAAASAARLLPDGGVGAGAEDGDEDEDDGAGSV